MSETYFCALIAEHSNRCLENRGLVAGVQIEGIDFRNLHCRVQPGPIGAEQNLAGTCSPHGLLKDIKAAHACGVREDIRVAYQMIDERSLCVPVVREAVKLPRCGMIKATSGYSPAGISATDTSPITSA